MPFQLRSLMGTLVNQVPSILWKLPQKSLSISRLEEKAQKMAVRLKSVKNIDQLYGSLVSEWTLEHDVVIGASQNYYQVRK